MLPLELLPMEVNAVAQKKSYKKNKVEAFGSGNGKTILTLLIKSITFYVELIIIYVR